MKCLNCKKETDNPKFCSRSCAAIYNNKKFPKRKSTIKNNSFCLWCGGKLNKNATKYCSRSCKPEYEYYIWLNKWKLGIIDGLQKFEPRPQWQLRRYLWDKYNGKCSRCGWCESNPFNKIVHLEIEHIDGDCYNNREENLDLICPNCHTLTSTYKSLNRGNGKRKLRIAG